MTNVNISLPLNNQLWLVSTNFILSEEQPQGVTSSYWRYYTLYKSLQQSDGGADPVTGMEMLQEVSQLGSYPTYWSMIYQLTYQHQAIILTRFRPAFFASYNAISAALRMLAAVLPCIGKKATPAEMEARSNFSS